MYLLILDVIEDAGGKNPVDSPRRHPLQPKVTLTFPQPKVPQQAYFKIDGSSFYITHADVCLLLMLTLRLLKNNNRNGEMKVAKYMSRFDLMLSECTRTIQLADGECETIADIETNVDEEGNGSIMTDGCAGISPALMAKVAAVLRKTAKGEVSASTTSMLLLSRKHDFHPTHSKTHKHSPLSV